MAQQILIRTPNHLGDCIMALPMISETKELYPNSELTVIVPEKLIEIFQNNPGVDHIIPMPPKYQHGLVAVTKLKELLEGKKYDVGFILPPSFGSAAGFQLAGVKERIGYIADGRRLLLSKPLPLPTPLNSVHRSELYFNLLRRITTNELEYVKPTLMLNDEDMQNGVHVLESYELSREHDFVTIAFQAVAESRRWGVEKYTQLIKRIISELNLKVVLIGSADDKKAGDLIAEACGTDAVKNISGMSSIRESAAILSLGKAFVGNDSGPAHLAAAVDCPVVVISGADDPMSTSPMATNKILIYEENLDCISCVKNRCPNKGDKFMACMELITVDRVFQAVSLIVV